MPRDGPNKQGGRITETSQGTEDTSQGELREIAESATSFENRPDYAVTELQQVVRKTREASS